MSDQKLKIAVFIDFDNVEIGVKTTLGLPFDVGAVLEAIKERGEIITKIAYGDWKRAGDHGRAMSQHAVRLVQRVMTPGGDKNGADINLALDALELAFTHDHINAFVIVGGDSDFITLVEKLKQYDKKVFVVGGRAFSSQVMQKNCTEFIAYENIAGRSSTRTDRGRPSGVVSLDQALPLVKRALKVLSDREVSPQLGLLKSTLLQLDSSFSERDFGASTFRDFAEKLEQRGLVSLKHSGRTTLVELTEAGSHEEERAELPPAPITAAATPEFSLADGVALVRAVLAEAAAPPRWPMYLRQMKQFLRTARPDFDERRYGSLPDLLRACQKDGLLRLERDRQGGLRAFAGATKPTNLSHGWHAIGENGQEAPTGQEEIEQDLGQPATIEIVTGESSAAPASPSATEPHPPSAEPLEADDQLAMFGAVSPMDPAPTGKRPRRRPRPAVDAPIAAEKPKRQRRAAKSGEPGRRPRRRTAKA